MKYRITITKWICAVIVMLFYVAVVSTAANAENPIEEYENWSPDLKRYTAEICNEYDVDYSLTVAVIYNESRFQSGLTHKNSNGTIDYGLMQVNEVNFDFLHRTLGINSMRELLDDEIGIRCGVALLAYHKQFTENDSSALLRYQIGAGKYCRYLKDGRTTNSIHQQVLRYFDTYKNHLAVQSQESKLNGFVTKDPIESILNMWADMLTS